MKKNYIFEKNFRLTSLSIHYIYISLKTVTIFTVGLKQKVKIYWEKKSLV